MTNLKTQTTSAWMSYISNLPDENDTKVSIFAMAWANKMEKLLEEGSSLESAVYQTITEIPGYESVTIPIISAAGKILIEYWFWGKQLAQVPLMASYQST